MSPPLHVLLVDDHAIVRDGLRMVLEAEPGIAVVGEAADGAEALARAEALRPDVVVLDLIMPGIDGLATLRQWRARALPGRILVLTSSADDLRVREALQAGATGYLLKDVGRAELVQAVRAAAAGALALHPAVQRRLIDQLTASPPDPAATLTPREREVLGLLAQGQSNKEIAAALRLRHGTVKTYVAVILGKLGVADRTQAALFAVQHGLAGDDRRASASSVIGRRWPVTRGSALAIAGAATPIAGDCPDGRWNGVRPASATPLQG
jgi:DNA-binding NarL/FixJ family response regulator